MRVAGELTGTLALYAALGLLSAQPARAQRSERDGVVERIDAAVKQFMTDRRVVGTSVGVMQSGRVLVAKGYGFADLENEVPATEHTVYRVGSITKQFTAAAIMLLVERGKLSLDDELTKFLPDYPTTGHRITVDRLLTHTSGIKGYTEMAKFWEQSRLDLTHDQMIALFSAEPFEFAPGERYQYNNSAYYLLGLIVEKVSGQSYADFLKQHVFGPLGLTETHYLDESPIVKHRAEGYEVRSGTVMNDDPLSMKLPYAAGSLGSNVLDLMKWQTALVANRLLKPESYARMQTPATLNDGSRTTYGYGLGMGVMEGRRKVAHGGGINGFRTQLAYYPDDRLIVVVLCNTGAANPEILESTIARLVLGIPEKTVVEVPIPEAQLRTYAGTYNPGRSPFRVGFESGALTLFGSRLRPVGIHRFVSADDPYQEVTFQVTNGEVTGVTVEREGQTTVAKRVTQ